MEGGKGPHPATFKPSKIQRSQSGLPLRSGYLRSRRTGPGTVQIIDIDETFNRPSASSRRRKRRSTSTGRTGPSDVALSPLSARQEDFRVPHPPPKHEKDDDDAGVDTEDELMKLTLQKHTSQRNGKGAPSRHPLPHEGGRVSPLAGPSDVLSPQDFHQLPAALQQDFDQVNDMDDIQPARRSVDVRDDVSEKTDVLPNVDIPLRDENVQLQDHENPPLLPATNQANPSPERSSPPPPCPQSQVQSSDPAERPHGMPQPLGSTYVEMSDPAVPGDHDASPDADVAHSEDISGGVEEEIFPGQDVYDDPGPVERCPSPLALANTPVDKKIMMRVDNIVKWERMLSCVCFSGRKFFTADQYAMFATALRTSNHCIRLNSYKTIRTSHWRDLLDVCFPSSALYHLSTLARPFPSGPRVKTVNSGLQDPGDCARVVMPSEWAKMDVLSLPFYQDVFGEDASSTRSSKYCFEQSAIVQHRAIATGDKPTMWAEYNDAVCPCERGDVLRFPCNSRPSGQEGEAIAHCWVQAARRSNDGTVTDHLVDGILDIIWLVGHALCAPDPAQAAQSFRLGRSPKELELITALHKTEPWPLNNPSDRTIQRRKANQPNELVLYPSDICAIIRSETSAQTCHVCLFVGSLVGYARGGSAERLVWVQIDDNNGALKEPYVRVYATTVVRALPTWIRGERRIPAFRQGSVRNNGRLPSGKPFVVYRFVIYADGFKKHKSLSDSRSVGGIYMLPLGASAETRRSISATRVIALAPHRHSPNEVYRIIHDDIIDGVKKGFEAVDPFGRPVQIFLDVVGMFGDYPALSSSTDVRGHNGAAFCTFCSVRDLTNSRSGSKIYTTVVHSRRLGTVRTDGRRRFIRADLTDAATIKFIGYSTLSPEDADELPMVRLARDLRGGDPRALDKDGEEVVPRGFDSQQSIAAAPDHLISGIINNTMEVCFSSLTLEEVRRIEVRVMHDAKANGLETQGRFLKWKDGRVDGLRSVSMSQKICILLSSVEPFNEKFNETGGAEFLLPRALQRFVASVYYWPNCDADGTSPKDVDSSEAVLRVRGAQHRAAKEFVQAASAVYRKNAAKGAPLNKANVHRALELCVHTLNNYGHGRHCSEMVLEMTHRSFKPWLETNPHGNSHITAVERAICNDWQGRLSKQYRTWCKGNDAEKKCSSRALRRLLLGEKSLSLHMDSRAGESLLDAFHDALGDAFREPVLSQLDMCSSVNDSAHGTYRWEVFQKAKIVPQDDTAIESKGILQELLTVQLGAGEATVEWYETTSFMAVGKFGGRRKSYAHHTLSRGTAVSVITAVERGNRLVVREAGVNEERRNKIFAVYGIMRIQSGEVWCSVREMKPCRDRYSINGMQPAVLKLGRRTRRVGLFHACDANCQVDISTLKMKHSRGVLAGGMYTVVDRAGGYPPHLG